MISLSILFFEISPIWARLFEGITLLDLEDRADIDDLTHLLFLSKCRQLFCRL